MTDLNSLVLFARVAEAKGFSEAARRLRMPISTVSRRIAELEEIVASAEVIDPSTLSGDHVKFGALVRLVDEETEKEANYQIVGVHEADIKRGRLSVSSPLAKALIGKKIGDAVSVPAPGGDRSYEILDVRFP